MSTIDEAKSAILLPPIPSMKDAPFVTMFSKAEDKQRQVIYPVSLYIRNDSGKMQWLGFLFTFLFTRKDEKNVAYITYPLCFDHTHKQEIYERLLQEVEAFAATFGVSRIIYEGYQHITGELFKPLSTVKFGNTPNKDFLEFVKSKGFTQKEVRPCYQIKGCPQIDSGEDIAVYTIADFHERRCRYLELCRSSDSFVQHFDLTPVIDYPPSITERFYFNEEWLIFTESNNQKGCLRWFPQSIFDKKMEKKAKIVRMLFCNASPEFICSSVTETLKRIATADIEEIRVADIPGNSICEDMLKNKGFSMIYETVYMEKHIDAWDNLEKLISTLQDR